VVEVDEWMSGWVGKRRANAKMMNEMTIGARE